MAVTGKRWKKNPTNYEKNKFLLGGNFRDPLNLNSLSDEKVIDKNKLAYVDSFKDSLRPIVNSDIWHYYRFTGVPLSVLQIPELTHISVLRKYR